MAGAVACPAAGVACPTWQTEDMCVSGKCLHFDGTDDYVDCGTGSSLNFGASDDMTLEAWFKNKDTMSGDSDVILNKREVNTQYLIRFQGNKIESYLRDPEDDSIVTHSDDDLNDGKWHYVAVTLDRNSNQVKMYIDGVLQSDIDDSSALGTMTNNAHLNIGRDSSDVLGTYFNGSIDEVRIYPYARTAAQIKKDYNAGLAGMGGGTEGLGAALGGGGSQKWMTDGLVGYWKMDEASANTCSGGVNDSCDSSGNGNDGAWNGDATSATGKFGNGVTFDGTGDYVNCGADTDLNITDAITIEAWVKWTSGQKIVSNYIWTTSSDNYGYQLKFKNNHIVLGCYNNEEININEVEGSTTVSTGVWHNVVGVYNGSTLKVYLDGIEDGSRNYANGIRSSDQNTYIGVNPAMSDYFNGSIDAVRIYNRALSPKEVRDLYNFAPGPVLHLKMDEKVSGNAQTLYDISTNENHGTTYWGANATGMDCSIPGKFGTACEFDGTDDYVSVSDFAY